MKPWWVTWYEHPHMSQGTWRHSRWHDADDARGWETGWRWADGAVRCVAAVFAPSAAAAVARVVELVGFTVEMAGQPVLMTSPPPNNCRGAEEWWNGLTRRAA